MEDFLTTIIYGLCVLIVAFLSSGITYFWFCKKEKFKKAQHKDSLSKKMEYIITKFDLVEACQRDTATLQLIHDTKKYEKEGSIPMHVKTLMLNVCETLHKQGANGDVTQCEHTLKGLEPR